MAPPTAFVLVVIISSVVSIYADSIALEEPKVNEQPVGGENFQYFNKETESVANELVKIKTGFDESWKEYIKSLEVSSSVSKALKKYNDAVDGVEGTKCAVSNDEFTGAEENIEVIIKTCDYKVPTDERNAFKEEITEVLKKVQAVDNTLQLNSALCSSLRTLPPHGCQQTKETALARLNGEIFLDLSRLDGLYKSAYFSAKNSIEKCVDDSTKDLKDNLLDSNNKIEICKATL